MMPFVDAPIAMNALKDVLEREYGREFTDDEFQKLLAEEIKG